MNNIYSVGYLGEQICVIADSTENAYKLLEHDELLYDTEIDTYKKFEKWVKVTPIKNGKFYVYDVWGYDE